MGEISKPIMTPVGVVYRLLCPTEAAAMKYSAWAAKMFGGTFSPLNLVGPGTKGYYEAVVVTTIAPNAKVVKPRAKGDDVSWHATPEPALVLYDSLESPSALYFHKREIVYKNTLTPPMWAYHTLSLEQW
jgi:hypothetical protein